MNTKTTFTIIICCSITFLCGIYAGGKMTEKEYLKRALELPEKDYFSNRDIEHILFNEPQE